jgi:hypothetical protein
MNQDEEDGDWLAQERAMETGGPRGSHALLARTLREPGPHGLPADFATRVAARARAGTGVQLEYGLLIALFAGLVVTAGVEVLAHGETWSAWLGTLLPGWNAPSSVWLLTLIGCLAASWFFEGLDFIERVRRAAPDRP